MNQVAPDGGGGGIWLDASSASAIAGLHAKAADATGDLSGSVPDVDAGMAAPDLHVLMKLVLRTTDQLALANAATAELVRGTAQHLMGTDEEVAAIYRAVDLDPFDGATPQISLSDLNSPFPPGWRP